MREIKFRAWEKEKKSWNSGKRMHTGFNFDSFFANPSYEGSVVYGVECEKGDTIEFPYWDDFKIMQYTGLKDLNGKEIYEGDIVKTPDNRDEFGMQAGEINEVYFGHGGFRLKAKYDHKAKGHWLEDDRCFEVIGNIYENPELMEEKKK